MDPAPRPRHVPTPYHPRQSPLGQLRAPQLTSLPVTPKPILDCALVEKAAFKVTPAEFKRLIEIDGVIPAPYLARASWVALEDFDALPSAELERLIRDAHALVFAALPKKIRATLV